MKRCPQCDRTYEDAKNFCLQDGTPLVADAPPPPQPPRQQGYQPETSPLHGAMQGQSSAWSQAGSWQPPGNLSGARAGRRRVWPWVVGVLAVVLVGGGAILGGFGYYVYRNVNRARGRVEQAGKRAPVAETRTFVNTREGREGALLEHYSDFSFEYPADWVLKESPGQSDSNFVKVERTEDDGTTTLENFAVGWYTSTGTVAGDAQIFPQLARQLSAQFASGFRGYKKASEGRTRVGRYEGYEFRFTAKLEGGGRSVDLFGRAVMIPSGSAAQRNGVALIMLATSLAPEIKSVADVGAKGGLPVILDSFRLGADAAGAGGDGGAEAESAAESEIESEVESAVRGAMGGEAGAPTDRGEVLRQLKEIEEEWARANMEGDKEAIRRILADEYVGTSHDGTTERKADYIKNLRPSTEIASPQEFEDLTLALAGGRAILTGITTVEFKDGRTGRFRFVDIFIWRGGRWQAVNSTSSQIS